MVIAKALPSKLVAVIVVLRCNEYKPYKDGQTSAVSKAKVVSNAPPHFEEAVPVRRHDGRPGASDDSLISYKTYEIIIKLQRRRVKDELPLAQPYDSPEGCFSQLFEGCP